MANPNPTPPALARAASAEFPDRESSRWCGELKTNGQGEEFNWGFRVYRTIYTPESDRDFATGMEILSAHLRQACFEDAKEDSGDPLDNFPNQQLWQRMRTDVVEDRAVLDGAPPAAIQKHFHAWIEQQGYHLSNDESPDPSLQMASSSSHRFCIIIDAEALQSLLRVPAHPTSDFDPREHIGVKVLDVECHEDSMEYEPPYDEGWLWAAPRELPEIWFECSTLAPSEMRETDDLGRPVVFLGF